MDSKFKLRIDLRGYNPKQNSRAAAIHIAVALLILTAIIIGVIL
jgi:hypothetical protein